MVNIKNNVKLIGYVGKDPEVRRLENGSVVARFSLATSNTYKDRHGEKQTQTDWHNIIGWRKTAELIEKIVKKGDELSVQGSLKYSTWEDNDGIKRTQAQVVIDSFHKHNKSQDIAPPVGDTYQPTGNGYAMNSAGQVQVTDADIDPVVADDDLPF